jgi:predicted transcriptional regulator
LTDSLEEKIIALLQKEAEGTMVQSELARSLGLNSREISRALAKLERRSIVERIQIKDGGRIAYKVRVLKKKPKIDPSDVAWCACLTCADLEKCGKGQPVSPELCTKLTASIRAEQTRLFILEDGKNA